MALIYPMKGTGTTLTLGTSTWEESGGIQIQNIDWDGIERAIIETTHLGSTAPASGAATGVPGTAGATNNMGGRTYMMGKLQDPGEITVECSWNANLVPSFMVFGVATNTETITITVPSGDAAAGTWVVTGGLKSFRFGIPLEDRCTATLVWKCSGIIAPTAGTA